MSTCRVMGGLADLVAYRKDPLGFTSARGSASSAHVVPLFVVGPIRAYLVNSAEAAEEVLLRRIDSTMKPRLSRSGVGFLGTTLVTSNGVQWTRRRQLLRPAFRRDAVAVQTETASERVRRHLQNWTHETIDAYDKSVAICLDLAFSGLTGTQLTLPDLDAAKDALLSLERSSSGTSIGSVLARWSPSATASATRNSFRGLERLAADAARGGDRGASDTTLPSVMRRALPHPPTEREIVEEVLASIIASAEPVGLAISLALYLLAGEEKFQSPLVAEIDEVVGERDIAMADLPRLTRLEAVALESLRLYPPGRSIVRAATENINLLGHHIPRGSSLLISQWNIQRGARYFERPSEFRPTRWLGDLRTRLPHFAFFPFGGGPRRCIGHELALSQIELVLGTIIRRFEVSLRPGSPTEPLLSGTLRPRTQLEILVKSRSRFADD